MRFLLIGTVTQDLLFFFHRAVDDIRAHLLTSIASLTALTLCLLILGAVFVVSLISDRIIPPYLAGLKAVAHLRITTGIEEQDNLARQLERWPEIESVAVVTKGEARKRLESQLGDWKGVLEGAGENLLPPSLGIKIKARLKQADDVESLLEKIRKIPQVDEVSYGKGWAGKLVSSVEAFKLALPWVVGFFAVAMLVISFNITELSMHGRSDELELFSIVGATNSFIWTPFFIESFLVSISSSGLAASVLFFSLGALKGTLPLPLAGALSFSANEVFLAGAGMIGVGTMVGWLGTWLALKR
ncbi:MAG: cell division protein FtsX [Syntrophobacteraceae bacterium]